MEENPRPQKRARTTPPAEICPAKTLRGVQLLLGIPPLLVHPPTHSEHKRSLALSLLALRRCLGLPNPGAKSGAIDGALDLSQPDECRAWCALADIGLCVMEGGFAGETWAVGIEIEVEKALGKAAPIAQRHPSLACYPSYITRLSARAAPHRARQLLRPSPSTFGSSAVANAGGTTAYYYTHLAWADHLLQAMLYPSKPALKSSSAKQTKSATTGTPKSREKDVTVQRDLAALRSALAPLLSASHANVTLLARLIELRALIALGRWAEVGAALERAEGAVGIAFPPSAGPDTDAGARQATEPPIYTTSPFHAALVVHVLVLGIVWFAYSAISTSPPQPGPENGAGKEGAGSASTPVPLDDSTPPLYIYSTHPRVLYVLGYLVSAVARRDLVGRKPKRKTFLLEGLSVVDREAQRELRVPRWASAGDVQQVEMQMAKIKADLMCELIAVSIMRSEFDDAERTLDAVIAHTRNHALFGGALAHRITLLHAQLAHALGRPARARTCYRVAAHLAEEVGDTGGVVAARAGEVALIVGMRARAKAKAAGRALDLPLAEESKAEAAFVDCGESELAQIGKELAIACRGLGGAMRAVGEVLEGVLTTEILKAKQHFKNALAYATECQDNHLRALILALIAAHYFHTAGDQAQKMLATCEQLAAGLGAPAKKGKEHVNAVGNAPLRLWVGERFLELHKRDKRDDLIQKREEANTVLRDAVVALSRRESAVATSVGVTMT
ncbi:hypothetical protein C8R45DRAFT_835641 [Mycena sanguinolenta]|nr:hypothetical protein C8R45DRAFT_835641 [Mycena sanguinolenta]